jgi:hypothetical protein
MAKKTTKETLTITLRGKEIPVERRMISLETLKFYPENPRVYSLVREAGHEPDQEQIEQALQTMEHVKRLVQSIRANGGVTDPLFVRGTDLVVLEGNSRLAACRALAAKDPVKWGRVKCDVVSDDITDDEVFALLVQYHIIGRKDWDPYEQAGLFWRSFRDGQTPREIAAKVDDMGVSAKRVTHMIAVYEFMVQHKDTSPTRWSYYDEYLKSQAIKKAREANPKMDRKVVGEIKSGKIPRAVDIRRNLDKVAKAGGKVLTTYLKGDADLDTCTERAEVSGIDNALLQKLTRFNKVLAGLDKKQCQTMPANQQKKCSFELSRILHQIERCRKFFEE